MPKKLVISLKGIVAAIEEVQAELLAAENMAATSAEKKKLAAKIKKLDKVAYTVKASCPKGKNGYNIVAL